MTVRAAELRGTEIRGAIIPRLIDELPVVMVMATQARGPDRHPRREGAAGEGVGPARGDGRDARRGGRADRALRGRLRHRGADAAPRRDRPTRLDHRIAMSMAVAQLFAGGEEVVLDDVACVATSFPSFFALLDALCGGRA